MPIKWLKPSVGLTKGIDLVNQLEEAKIEKCLQHIIEKLKSQKTQIFTEVEKQKLGKIFKIDGEKLVLVINTVVYITKRMMKFISKPAVIQYELEDVGLNSSKAECFVKLWSTQMSSTLDEIGVDVIETSRVSDNFSWILNAELSSDYHKKSKVPKVYLSVNETEVELVHSEIHSLYLQLESIQHELDQLSS